MRRTTSRTDLLVYLLLVIFYHDALRPRLLNRVRFKWHIRGELAEVRGGRIRFRIVTLD